MTAAEPKYAMALSLNILRHLGFGLYSNIAAVLSEVVANAWDADAERVTIRINPNTKLVTIEDDGHGMTVKDANQKYLLVGYERRDSEGRTPRFKRQVMGRKGIGKLSLFSIAQTVEVHSVKGGVKHGFIMDSEDIKNQLQNGREAQYNPTPVDASAIEISKGTRIQLTNMKRQLQWTGSHLRRRLARRFSITGSRHDFEIVLDGSSISIEDRDYQDKLQYVWAFGALGREAIKAANNVEESEVRPSELSVGDSDYSIDGWIGTAFKSGQLKDADTNDSINKIVLMVRGKLAQEDILEEFGEGGLYTKYVFGEIHADFLDLDDQEDIATTSRQRFIEEDERYRALKSKLLEELKHIQGKWTDLRNEQGESKALEVPQIKTWIEGLDPDQRKAARKLFGRINRLPIEDDNHLRQLFVSGVLAFESLKLRNLLHRLEEISVDNLDVLQDVFIQLDDLEASAYYQIAKDRIEVIRKLTNLVDENAKEKALQKHLFKHLWLLDPSWERATHTEAMEKRIYSALNGVSDTMTKEQKAARLDIYYSTTGKRHVIIELKRADRRLTTLDLLGQITSYYSAAERVLQNAGKGSEPLEVVCVVGNRLRDWDDSITGEERSRDTLSASKARVVLYDELIENALQAYQDFVDRGGEAGRVYRLIQEISDQDAQAINPASD